MPFVLSEQIKRADKNLIVLKTMLLLSSTLLILQNPTSCTNIQD